LCGGGQPRASFTGSCRSQRDRRTCLPVCAHSSRHPKVRGVLRCREKERAVRCSFFGRRSADVLRRAQGLQRFCDLVGEVRSRELLGEDATGGIGPDKLTRGDRALAARAPPPQVLSGWLTTYTAAANGNAAGGRPSSVASSGYSRWPLWSGDAPNCANALVVSSADDGSSSRLKRQTKELLRAQWKPSGRGWRRRRPRSKL
jgi:hypothetical protein